MPNSPSLIVLPEIDSTNAEAMRRAKEGERGPLWIMADRQTAGRGRSGRHWVSEHGNLHVSLLIELACPPEAASRLSLVAGVAVIDAIRALLEPPASRQTRRDSPPPSGEGLGVTSEGKADKDRSLNRNVDDAYSPLSPDLTPTPNPSPQGGGESRRLVEPSSSLPLRLKWPNDILIGAQKAGGVLIETTSFGAERGLAAAIGVGLNLAHAPPSAPEATSLAAKGVTVTPREMLDHLAPAMRSWLAVWDQGVGFEAIRQAWLDRAGKIGERVSVKSEHGFVAGRFAGLDADGALLMEDGAGRRRRFTFGDVALV